MTRSTWRTLPFDQIAPNIAERETWQVETDMDILVARIQEHHRNA